MLLPKPSHKGKTRSEVPKIEVELLPRSHTQGSKPQEREERLRADSTESVQTSLNSSLVTESSATVETIQPDLREKAFATFDAECPARPPRPAHQLLPPSKTVTLPSTVRGKVYAPLHSPADTSVEGGALMDSFIACARQPRVEEEKQRPSAELKFPINPTQALAGGAEKLSGFELAEVLEYPQIYFLGLHKSMKNQGTANSLNRGFDDDKGNYLLLVGDHIAYRYEILGLLGKGSFGQVCKCFDHKHQEFVAVKIIRNKKRFRQQGAIEVKVLELMRNKDPRDEKGVVKIKNSFLFRRHICMTLELLSCNLFQFLQTTNKKGVSQNLVRRFALQLILALQFSKSLGVIHCDLKPENILLKQPDKSGIKIIDFGSACLESEKVYTYIQSRYYRAPEIILGIPYTTAIDMWSLGCLLAEIFIGTPLFQGENEHDQLLCMMEVLGHPPSEVIHISARRKLFFDGFNPRIVSNSKGKRRVPGSKSLQTVAKGASPLFVDFLAQCFCWDPKRRLTPEAALAHGWIQEGIVKMQQANAEVEAPAKKKTSKK